MDRLFAMAIGMAVYLGSIVIVAAVTAHVAPNWSRAEVFIWSIAVFLAAWRAASDFPPRR